MGRRIVDEWVNRPGFDYLIVVFCVILGATAGRSFLPDDSTLGVWYQTLAATNGVLLGFGGVALTVVFAVAPNARLERVYQVAGFDLAHIAVSSLASLALTTFGFSLAFLLDPDREALAAAFVFGLISLAASRFGRLWWVLSRVLTSLMIPGEVEVVASSPAEDWQRPDIGPADYPVAPRRPEDR